MKKFSKIMTICGLIVPPITTALFLSFFWNDFMRFWNFWDNNAVGVIVSEFPLEHKYFFIFLASMLLSETAVIPLFFLSAMGFSSAGEVLIFSFLGVLVADMFWYFLGAGSFFQLMEYFSRKNISDYLSKISIPIIREKPFLLLMVNKFLNIPSFVAIMYLKARKINFKKFIICELGGLSVWLLSVMVIGWLAGRGVYNFLPLYHNLNIAIIMSIVFYLLFKLSVLFFKRKFMAKNKINC